MTQRISKTSLYLQMFEESINRKNKYSIQGTEEFCMRPDTLLDRCDLKYFDLFTSGLVCSA